MNRKPLTAALGLAMLGLAACGDRDEMAANSKICLDFKPAQNAQAAAPMTVTDAAAPLDDCVRRWAYSLASSKDGAETVAAATVAACGAVLSRWNQQAIAQAPGNGPDVQALSLTTGEPTNPIQEHNAFANNRALFYVVQARAGRCAAPPAANGAPTGLTG